MRLRPVMFVLLAVILIASQGCAGHSGGKKTGFAYILHQSGAAGIDVPGEKQAVPGFNTGNRSRQPQNPPAQNKKVFLTFDDGPNAINTPLVLDILDRYGVKATFFVVGTNIEKHPEILKDIVKRGHALGNHTYNHRYSDVYSGSNAFLKSIKTNEDLIYRITGQRPRIVRDPGGEVRNSRILKDILAKNGYRLVDWNVDSYDSRVPSLEGPDIIESISRQSMKQHLWPGMVILMHDGTGHMNTVRALPTVIEMLKNRGFRFEILK